jgi:hypothetical protein
MNNNFFQQLIVRLAKKNPAFFDYIQAFAALLGGASIGFHYLDVHHAILPQWLQWVESSTTWISSAIAAIIAQLPNEDANTTATK